MNPDLEYAIRTLGHAVGSHIVSRSNLSGRSGRYEETLTADLTDLMHIYGQGCDAYLADIHAHATMRVRVWDLPKSAEKRVGADFVLVLRGRFFEQTQQDIRKLVLVQAKRLDWGQFRYAASTNHVAKAQAMLAARRTLVDCFFAYYHDSSVLPHIPSSRVAPAWPVDRGGHGSPPRLWYATPTHGEDAYLAKHPSLRRPTFIERSGYRPMAIARAKLLSAPAEWAWGTALAGADYFIDSSGVVQNNHLPSVRWTLNNGTPIDEWLVGLADCRIGTNIKSAAQLRSILNDVTLLGKSELGEVQFTPSCIVDIAATSGVERGAHDDVMDEWMSEMEANELFRVGLQELDGE